MRSLLEGEQKNSVTVVAENKIDRTSIDIVPPGTRVINKRQTRVWNRTEPVDLINLNARPLFQAQSRPFRWEIDMSDGKQTRVQFTKAEKRVMAEETTRFAAADQLKRKAERDAKTERLRALRFAQADLAP